jgi:hypothetical protein
MTNPVNLPYVYSMYDIPLQLNSLLSFSILTRLIQLIFSTLHHRHITKFSRVLVKILFSVPQVENKVKTPRSANIAEIQEAVIGEVRKVRKEEFSATFQKLYGRAKACIYDSGIYVGFKKLCDFLMCLRILKI